MTSHWSSEPVVPHYGFARTRDLAFAAVRRLWKVRQNQGMSQVDLAKRLGRDTGWVSRKLSGPTNWTLRTLGELADALDGEIEINIVDLHDGPPTGNYDAYLGYGEQPLHQVSLLASLPATGGSAATLEIAK